MDRVRKVMALLFQIDPSQEATWRLALKFYFKALEMIIRGAEILSDKPVCFCW